MSIAASGSSLSPLARAFGLAMTGGVVGLLLIQMAGSDEPDTAAALITLLILAVGGVAAGARWGTIGSFVGYVNGLVLVSILAIATAPAGPGDPYTQFFWWVFAVLVVVPGTVGFLIVAAIRGASAWLRAQPRPTAGPPVEGLRVCWQCGQPLFRPAATCWSCGAPLNARQR